MINTKDDHSYFSIFKSISVFSFVHFFKLLTGVLSAKFSAIFLGPSGVGVLGLIRNSINLIDSLTNFRLTVVGLKEISHKINSDDTNEIEGTVQLIKQTSLAVGLFGCILTILLSFPLSNWIFDSYGKFYYFIFLSFTFILNSYSSACLVILKAFRKLKNIAFSSVISSLISTLFILYFYYEFGIDGIILGLISSSIIVFIVFYLALKKIPIKAKKINWIQFKNRVKPLLKLGLILSVNSILGYLFHLLIRFYISNYGNSLEDLGFYEVGLTILTSYVGLFFKTMSSDYFPRLTSLINNKSKYQNLVNKQIDLTLILITPLIILFYLLGNFIIKILYSDAFLAVELILHIGLISLVLKSIVWPLDYIVLAKGNNRQYFIQQLLGDILNLILTILLYNFYGLIGIGISITLNFILSGLYLLNYVVRNYDFKFSKKNIKTIYTSLVLTLSACFSYSFFDGNKNVILLSMLFFISIIFSIYSFRNRILEV